MAFLEAQVSQPKIGEMVYSTFTETSLTSSKLQLSLNIVQSHLKLEKVSSLSNLHNIIKYLEEMVINVGFDPSNSKVMEEIIKKKNADIAALKKKLKLPATKDPQEKDLGETKL